VINEIGHGGFGNFYEAHDTTLNRLVALKVLHRADVADPAAAREGEAAARLAHPNIAALHDVGVTGHGFPYLVYEILHGETLESRVARGPIPPGEALAIATQVTRALAHAHAHGVVHRDLKPANVFLTAEGDVKVLDFGLALLFGRAAPAGGTPAYMAPEQRRGAPEDARTDLFALGLLVREMCTGERGGAQEPPSASVSPPIQRVLASLLAEDPAARPRGARAALDLFRVAERTFATRDARRRRIVLSSATAIFLAVAAIAALVLRERVRPSASGRASTPSVVVLPFSDLSAGRDQEYFAEGVSEEIVTALTQVEGLRVIGQTSVSSIKEASPSSRES
jgi:eukaryotic-like serine/threonine-protein kinase